MTASPQAPVFASTTRPTRPWLNRIVSATLLAALLGGGFSFWKLRQTPPTPAAPVRTATVQIRELTETVHLNGEVTPAVRAEIRSENSGLISRIHVHAGAQVKKGAILLELDRAELESQVTESTIEIETTKLNLEKSERDYKRTTRMFEEKGSSEKELHDARINASLAENSLKLQEARLETLKRKLDKTILFAPFDGIILEVNVEEGMVIVGANGASAGTILMKAADLENLLVSAKVNEVDVAKLSDETKLEVTFDSIPALKAEGILKFISPAALSRENEKEIREFQLKVALTTRDTRIRPGMSANLTVPVAQDRGPSAELSAVFSENDRSFVYVEAGGKFNKRTVTCSVNDNSFAVFTEGLKEGEVIALERPPQSNPDAQKKK